MAITHGKMHDVKIKRLLKGSREKVFAAFSEKERLLQWYSPSPDIILDVLLFNFEVDGQYRFCYVMPDGSAPVLTGVYDVIVPEKELGFTWVWEFSQPSEGAQNYVHIEFIEKEAMTEVVLTHQNLPSEEACVEHAEGWKRSLDRLEKTLPLVI